MVTIQLTDLSDYIAWYSTNTEDIFITSHVNEYNIEEVLEHEYLHHILKGLINYETSILLDNIIERIA